jgi:nitrite reductase (NO-forming)
MVRRLRAVLAAPLLLPLAGCVADSAPAVQASDAAVVVAADDLFYAPEVLELVTGEAVALQLRNDGSLVHDLVLENGWESGELHPGDTVTMEFNPPSTSVTGWCSIPGHRDAGMELELVVREAGSS